MDINKLILEAEYQARREEMYRVIEGHPTSAWSWSCAYAALLSVPPKPPMSVSDAYLAAKFAIEALKHQRS